MEIIDINGNNMSYQLQIEFLSKNLKCYHKKNPGTFFSVTNPAARGALFSQQPNTFRSVGRNKLVKNSGLSIGKQIKVCSVQLTMVKGKPFRAHLTRGVFFNQEPLKARFQQLISASQGIKHPLHRISLISCLCFRKIV